MWWGWTFYLLPIHQCFIYFLFCMHLTRMLVRLAEFSCLDRSCHQILEEFPFICKSPSEKHQITTISSPFVSFIPFFVLVTFGDKVTKIWKYYVIFVYILQGKIGKMEKKGLKSCNQNTKNQKTKIWDERNINFIFIWCFAIWKRNSCRISNWTEFHRRIPTENSS